MKFRKKPIEVEAEQWFGIATKSNYVVPYGVHGLLKNECDYCHQLLGEHGWISTFEGGHIVCPGDWIITGVLGEKYPCKPDVFELTYEEVK